MIFVYNLLLKTRSKKFEWVLEDEYFLISEMMMNILIIRDYIYQILVFMYFEIGNQ